MRLNTIILAIAALTSFCATSAQAATELVKNGGFESSTGVGQFDHTVTISNWSSTGYNFLFGATGADSVGVNGQYGNLSLWGANNGGANALASSHNGGQFVAADGAFGVAAVTQTINGLTAGKKYTLNFEWAAAQQQSFDGTTTEQWLVNLGSNAATTQATAVYHNANHASSSWMQETMTFTAAGTSQVLSFLAVGTPDGKPPFSLLDGVSMVAEVPEPSEWAMLFAGLGLMGFMARRRRHNNAA